MLMSSLALHRAAIVRAYQGFARLPTVRHIACWESSGSVWQTQQRSFTVYRGGSIGYRSPKVAARAQHEAKATSAQLPPKPEKSRDAFCRICGTKMELAIPKGEAAWRQTCSNCGYIDYVNPKMVVGCIVEHEGKILLCQRAIEPCKGKWTLPAGYMELRESSAEGAARETWEEANCQVEILAPYSHFDIPVIGQAYILFRAKLAAPYTFSPGEETLQTAMFAPEEIPFDEIAFSSISLALQYYLEDMKIGTYRVHHGVVAKQPGSGPNEAGRFQLQDHFAVQTQEPVMNSAQKTQATSTL